MTAHDTVSNVYEPATNENHHEARARAVTLLEMITSYRVTQALHVAAELGLADLLRDGAKPASELATATATDAMALYRLLRALAGLGIVREVGPGTFELTPLGSGLRSDISGSMRAWGIMVGGEHHWLPWQHLLHSVRTGEPAFERVLGNKPFDYYARHPEAGRTFQDALRGLSEVVCGALSDSYDFSAIENVVDVGGGSGALLLGLLHRHPTMRGVLFDQPSVVERSAQLVSTHPVSDRCKVVAGDFFAEIPTGGDAYILKHILHDWEDEKAIDILKRCREAMRPDARLLIVEMVIAPGNDRAYSKLLDLEMLVSYTGRERTADEYRELLARSGFSLRGIAPTDALVSVIEAGVA